MQPNSKSVLLLIGEAFSETQPLVLEEIQCFDFKCRKVCLLSIQITASTSSSSSHDEIKSFDYSHSYKLTRNFIVKLGCPTNLMELSQLGCPTKFDGIVTPMVSYKIGLNCHNQGVLQNLMELSQLGYSKNLMELSQLGCPTKSDEIVTTRVFYKPDGIVTTRVSY